MNEQMKFPAGTAFGSIGHPIRRSVANANPRMTISSANGDQNARYTTAIQFAT